MTTQTEVQKVHSTYRISRIPFGEIRDPGCYVNVDTGELLRLPLEVLEKGHSPIFEIVSLTGPMMVKLTDDPWLPIGKARQVAADLDIYVNF